MSDKHWKAFFAIINSPLIDITIDEETDEYREVWKILPSNLDNSKKYLHHYNAKKIKKPFSYNSFENKQKLNGKDIKKLLNSFK